MAKIGEGDPRWIVNERNDGKNVNSWHWEEKDLSNATHEALKEAFKGYAVPSTDSSVSGFTFTELSEISGDVTVAQRKGKIMCYFEIKMTAKWEATVGEAKVEGKLVASEVEHDNFAEDFDISVSTVQRSAEASKAEAIAQKAGRKAFRAITKEYFDGVFKKYNVGTKVPSAGSPSAGAAAASSPVAAAPKPIAVSKPAATTAAATSVSGDATSFSWVMDWNAPATELFRTLTDASRASAYTRCPAVIDPRAAGTFQYLNGAITGYFTELEEGKKIIMQWRLGSWAANHHSTVIMDLVTEEHGRTRLNFAQAGIPAGEVDRVKQGWNVNFFEPIKMMMGYGLTWVQQ